jgi:hypothetical protein
MSDLACLLFGSCRMFTSAPLKSVGGLSDQVLRL